MYIMELIGRCRAGERQALDELYQQYRPQLLRICKQYTKDDGVSEDLLHDAFVVILTSLDKLKDDDKLEAWMASIVRNVGYHYRDHLIREQSTLRQLGKESEGMKDTALSPDYEQLQTLVSQLPQGYQQVFRLSVFEGLSHQEIGQLLGIAPHSSSSQLSHAKRMLQTLIKQSWILILLLIAIPTAVWKLLYKHEPEIKPIAATPKPHESQSEPVAETPHDELVYASVSKAPTTHLARYQTETVIQPDSIPYYNKERIDTLAETAQEVSQEEERQQDTLIYQQLPSLPTIEEPVYAASTRSKSSTWDIRLAYNGQMGQRDDYLAATTIVKGSFNATSNSPIPSEHAYDNWIDYHLYLTYLNNGPNVSDDMETRALMNIAAQNSAVNSGMMEAHYEHKLPVTIQLLLGRPLSNRLSFETGLSYTRLSSTKNTGSSQAYIQERQRLHYLGIPIRLGWQWYSKAHLSLYSSVGTMLELPIRSVSDINYIDNGISTFQKKEALSVPCQWSTTLGLGLQYDFTPHLGIYLEPSLQYFFDDGSDIKTYRMEHPFSMTLPLGIRFHW